jgi:hypothetical protein
VNKLYQILNINSEVNFEKINQVSNHEFERILQTWFLALTPFAQRTKNPNFISNLAIEFRDKLGDIIRNKNIYTLDLELFGLENSNNEEILKFIQNLLEELDDIDEKLGTEIMKLFFTPFNIKLVNFDADNIIAKIEDLISRITDEKILLRDISTIAFPDRSKQELFSIFKDASSPEFSIENFIKALAKRFTSLFPKDWNDDTINVYEQRIIELAVKLLDPQEINDAYSKNKLVYWENDELEKELTFSIQEISPIGQMVLKTLTHNLELSGRSLSDNEKINIINELLKSIVEKK